MHVTVLSHGNRIITSLRLPMFIVKVKELARTALFNTGTVVVSSRWCQDKVNGSLQKISWQSLQCTCELDTTNLCAIPDCYISPLSSCSSLSFSNMSRSATDATRFTSTTPHATSISQSTARLQDQRKKKIIPSGETPLEKVRRLRAAADRARDAQVSTVDKMIIRGRVWADIAHRTTTLFLIGCTGKL
jgi:hypothetical protein